MTPKQKLENARQKQRELENARHGAQAELSDHDSAWEAHFQDCVARGEVSPDTDKGERGVIAQRLKDVERELVATIEMIPHLESEVYSEQAQESRNEADSLVEQANEIAEEFEQSFNKTHALLCHLNELHDKVHRAESLCHKRAGLCGKTTKDFPAREEFQFDLREVNQQVAQRMTSPSEKPKHLYVMKEVSK